MKSYLVDPSTLRLPAIFLTGTLTFLFASTMTAAGAAQSASSGSTVATVEISPAEVEGEVGEEIRFRAIARDETGALMDLEPSTWFAAPWDLGAIEHGTLTLHRAGKVRVGAVIQGKTGYATVYVKPSPIETIEIAPLGGPVVVGGLVKLTATARDSRRDPREDARLTWTSDRPAVATIDEGGILTAVSPGRAHLVASAEGASARLEVDVVENPVAFLSITPGSSNVRTGDVIRFVASAKNREGSRVDPPVVRWTVSGSGASIGADGAFVADLPGSYSVVAVSGREVASASVVVSARNAERELVVIGHVPTSGVQVAEQWIFGNYAYLSSVGDQIEVYDISHPSEPIQTDKITFDARLINDVSVTADGKVGVATREGASTRKNGIVFMDTSNPAHPTIVSEYTKTVTGGVHSAFIDGHYVYLTDDATGSLRIIDFEDILAPREVARWEVESVTAKTITSDSSGGELSSGRYLHDVYVKDGLAYLAYWRDGLVILDVGNGIKGGTPETPRFVSQLRFDYHDLYGDDWLAGAHTVFRYENYVFLGDEVFPAEFDIRSKERIPVRGVLWVVDVSDLETPTKVAEYGVPEAGAHNVWVEDDILYMGYYNGGARVVDVSGELRGDLYRQGREIARFWTGDPEGFRPNMPFTWGAQPQGDLIFFNDLNSGLWILKLGEARKKGTTTAPGY
jgi:hypothetical protein